VKPITVTDPRGVAWNVYLGGAPVHTDALERAVERSNLSEEDKRKRRRRYGVRMPTILRGVSRKWPEISSSFVMHAISKNEHRAWISPALTRRQARADLDELAAQIKVGQEPAGTPHP
jgi:hypothetical protein